MKQAKVLTDAEMKRLLAVVAQGKHAARNRMALMLSHLAGLRCPSSEHLAQRAWRFSGVSASIFG